MKCKNGEHQWKTVSSTSRESYKNGEKKFKPTFEEGVFHRNDIDIFVVRKRKCLKCGDNPKTVEVDRDKLIGILKKYEALINDGNNAVVEDSALSKIENMVRIFLISICKGDIDSRHAKKAMYKEVWSHIYPSRQFGRGNTNEVVGWIVNISNYDIANGNPPLNSLVVRGDTKMPGDSWEDWRRAYESPYKSVEDAQNACWDHWC